MQDTGYLCGIFLVEENTSMSLSVVEKGFLFESRAEQTRRRWVVPDSQNSLNGCDFRPLFTLGTRT